MRLGRLFVLAGATALGLVLSAGPVGADRLPGSAHGGEPFSATLTGTNEVPPNASVASGTANVTVNAGQAEVCWDLSFSDLSAPATAAHIHVSPAGTNGPVVIPIPVPSAAAGDAAGCAAVDRGLAQAIQANPDGYYVNVHDAVYPGGEIRDQLHGN